jgi:hypothetical protein
MKIAAIAAVLAGGALVVIAVASATLVADSREGLIAEVVTLLASVAGIGLLVYGLTARRDRSSASSASQPRAPATAPRPRTTRDLMLGAGGVALAALLVGGLAVSGGTLWAALGFVLLLPMVSGSVYLFVRFLRANP